MQRNFIIFFCQYAQRVSMKNFVFSSNAVIFSSNTKR
uniref:Transcriptional regulator n=1 Tax=Ascaris lumbricoides TaxID=6252 RepID=A0A0M3IT81_ASCLU